MYDEDCKLAGGQCDCSFERMDTCEDELHPSMRFHKPPANSFQSGGLMNFCARVYNTKGDEIISFGPNRWLDETLEDPDNLESFTRQIEQMMIGMPKGFMARVYKEIEDEQPTVIHAAGSDLTHI